MWQNVQLLEAIPGELRDDVAVGNPLTDGGGDERAAAGAVVTAPEGSGLV